MSILDLVDPDRALAVLDIDDPSVQH